MVELGSRATSQPINQMTSGVRGDRITYTPDLSLLPSSSLCLTTNDEYSDPALSMTTVMSDDERASLTSVHSLHASADSITSKRAEFPDQAQSL